jgi:glycerol kinase
MQFKKDHLGNRLFRIIIPKLLAVTGKAKAKTTLIKINQVMSNLLILAIGLKNYTDCILAWAHKKGEPKLPLIV